MLFLCWQHCTLKNNFDILTVGEACFVDLQEKEGKVYEYNWWQDKMS